MGETLRYFFPLSRSKSRSRVSKSFQIWLHAISIGRGQGSEWRFQYYESLGLSAGRNRVGFFISSQGCHVTTNLGYLTKSSKPRIHFLGHGMRSDDENWYGMRSTTDARRVQFIPRFNVGVKVTGVRNLSNMAPRQMYRLRQGQWN